jgi:hypothetical protein
MASRLLWMFWGASMESEYLMDKQEKPSIFFERLQAKWGLESFWDVGIVFFVFALTGTSAVWVKVKLYQWFGLGDSLSTAGQVIFFLCITLPTYQALLLIYGFIFGKFSFFLEKEKKMFSRIAKLFSRD